MSSSESEEGEERRKRGRGSRGKKKTREVPDIPFSEALVALEKARDGRSCFMLMLLYGLIYYINILYARGWVMYHVCAEVYLLFFFFH
jgi:hypothetical protein